MSYDAVLVARRGLGPEELRLASPMFLAAIRWALFAEQGAIDLSGMRRIVATDPSDGLTGADRTAFMSHRIATRAALAERERIVYPEDDDG